MSVDTQSRKWLITMNLPLEKGYTHERIKYELSTLKSVIYFCISDEIAGKHHTHVYVLASAPIRFSTLKKHFEKAHIEKAYGTSSQNRDYVFKEGKWLDDKKKETNLQETHEEWGEIPQERQGARNDLTELYELISDGLSNYEILEHKPEFIAQIERMDKVRQIIQEEQYKEVFRNLEVTYVYGDTGAGKTRSVMAHGYANVFRITNYKNPFDQYRAQDVICFEEFDSSLPINQMLLYLDGYPVMLPCRYSDKVACFTKVYILSNIDLRMQYAEVQSTNRETWKAFLRRIHNVEVYRDGKHETYTTKEYLSSFRVLSNEELAEIPFKESK